MTDNSAESELTRRKGGEVVTEKASEKETCENAKHNEEVLNTWQKVKYYFDRFRYYHFIVADTIDKYASAACLWIISLYFRFILGVGEEPASVLTEED